MKNYKSLGESAGLASKNAYAEYSGFEVGAALLTADGRIFTGCNIENCSYGLTVCAERVAVFKAVSEGYKEYKALAVFSHADPPARPCGACLQVLAEFGPDIDVLCVNAKGDENMFGLKELLPEGFTFKRNIKRQT